MQETTARWLRPALAGLAAIQLVTGAWAVVAPRNWYDDFPGSGRDWVQASGPFNEHLSVDAGAGFLAVGAALLLAAVWLDRRVVQSAAVVLFVHALPHATYHVTHHVEEFSLFDTLAGEWSLVLEVVAAVAIFVAASRSSAGSGEHARPARSAPASGGR